MCYRPGRVWIPSQVTHILQLQCYATYPVVLPRVLLLLIPGTSQPPVLQDLQGFGFFYLEACDREPDSIMLLHDAPGED
jgi:hypothetical protein